MFQMKQKNLLYVICCKCMHLQCASVTVVKLRVGAEVYDNLCFFSKGCVVSRPELHNIVIKECICLHKDNM